MANPSYPLKPVQDGVTVISNARGVYKLTEFNSYGLIMNKQVASQDEMINGHASQTIHIETLCQNFVLFFLTARKFLDKLSFGGPLSFRFKLERTRGKRALIANKQSTVLEDYVRLDRNLFLTDLQNDIPTLLENLLHEVAWSLGLQISPEEIRILVLKSIQEVIP